MMINCFVCGKEINKSPCLIKDKNFCSLACRGVFNRKEPNANCSMCGKPVCVKPSILKRGNNIYCHDPCYSKKPTKLKDLNAAKTGKTRLSISKIKTVLRQNISRREKAELLNSLERDAFSGFVMPYRKHIFPVWRECSRCDKIFLIKSLNMIRSHFCRRGCGKIKPIEERSVTQKKCGHCGKPIVIDNHKVLDQNFCSIACVTAYRWANGLISVPKGEECHNWKGGVTYNKAANRYPETKMVQCPPEFIAMARTNGYVLESRLVMAQTIGRPLLSSEVVHHIDRDPSNNSPDNLMLFANQSEHILAEHGKRKNQ